MKNDNVIFLSDSELIIVMRCLETYLAGGAVNVEERAAVLATLRAQAPDVRP